MQKKVDQFDVVVLGAGASGLMCAITAAQRGRSVLILECANKVGKKILMSGGGRCNFTNQNIDDHNFICENPHFFKSAFKRYTQWDFIALVESHSIEYEQRKHTQLFCKKSAKDILNMLLDKCNSLGVVIKTGCKISQVESLQPVGPSCNEDAQAKKYRVAFNTGDKQRDAYCDSVVVATGALSIPTLGGSGFGYDVAKQYGLGVSALQAGLVPFMFSGAIQSLCERLSGLSLEVNLSCNGQEFRESMLFTHRGMSGPAVLQISNYWHPGDWLTIDLMPDKNAQEWLCDQKKRVPRLLLRTLLSQCLPKALVAELQALWWADYSHTPLADFTDRALMDIGVHLNNWRIKPSATEGYRTAEVTLGGVDTQYLSSKTMEVKHQPGLYFIGEVVDVTGHLGGFNFQWAWSSGYAAGMFA